MRRLPILAAAAALALASPAFAGQPVTLKADTANADGVVTLGDLFDGAGAAARTPVARRIGESVVLSAQAVQAAARHAGLDWANAEGLSTIVVRAGTASAVAARGNVQVLTYARDIAAGEVVGPADIVWAKAAAAPGDAARDPDAVIGMSARRPLRSGAVVAAHDVAAPIVIKAGEIITVAYEAEGISLALQGKALSAGGVGDTLNVENTASKKVIQAVVAGPGQAVVGPAAEQLKPRSTRIALR